MSKKKIKTVKNYDLYSDIFATNWDEFLGHFKGRDESETYGPIQTIALYIKTELYGDDSHSLDLRVEYCRDETDAEQKKRLEKEAKRKADAPKRQQAKALKKQKAKESEIALAKTIAKKYNLLITAPNGDTMEDTQK